LEMFRQWGILEMFRQWGILEMFRQWGSLEMFRQWGILEYPLTHIYTTTHFPGLVQTLQYNVAGLN
jgi:hypothetical protein